jgi:gluconolactonase
MKGSARRTALLCMVAASAVAMASAAAAQLLPGERATDVQAISDVVAAGAKWEIVRAGFGAADGIVGTPDGGLLFGEEQSQSIRRLDAAGKETVVLNDKIGAPSAVSLDAKGRLYTVMRTCTDPGLRMGVACQDRTSVRQVSPDMRVLASSFADGRPLGRLNDLIADGKGGAYFTVGGAYYVNSDGVISVVAEQGTINSNGIMLSPDGKTLYVTNNTDVQAFDVQSDGSTRNRRTFGGLNGDNGADGMAVDGAGRLYVTCNLGVHVLSAKGEHIGVIPTLRRAITVAFSGPDKKMLYVSELGVVGPDGKNWTTPEGIRNTASTIRKLPMVAQGFMGRPK